MYKIRMLDIRKVSGLQTVHISDIKACYTLHVLLIFCAKKLGHWVGGWMDEWMVKPGKGLLTETKKQKKVEH